LAFQNSEKQKRADELEIANIKLAFQNTEKQKRADELEIANIELAFEKTEKEKRAIELEKVQRIATLNESFKTENEDLISEGTQKEKLVTKLKFQNSKKEKMVTQLQIANNNNQKLNQQVNHLQKVESIGRLTAGISHDFNNILGCMLGYNEMNNDIRDEMKDDALKSELDNNTKQIANAGQRAVALIDKMMTYARQNEESKIELDERTMNVKIQDVLEMLKPILTSKIQLNFVTDCDCVSYPEQDNCAIQIDTSSLHQIITNLTVNARDAMKEVGNNITISLKKVVLSDIHCMACGEMMRGEFIKLAVTDNGSGMKQKIIRRIFDPFFTTKPQGEGTGLGLSTTMGLVHSAKGHILVKSHVSGPNQGSSFQLLFPILT
jgi:signal transduction histidine kinase